MNSFTDLKNGLKSYKNLPLSHKLFISVRYFMVPWNRIIEKIGNSGQVLDIGSGHALFLNLLSSKRPNILCYGFEPDVDKNRVVKDQLVNKNVILISKEELDDFSDNSFDFIVISDVLYCVHSNNWKEILNLAHRILKPDGLLIIKETDNKPKLKYLLCVLQENIAIKVLRYTKGEKPKFFPSKYYLNQFHDSGFKVVEHYPINKWYPWPHYLFVLKK